MEGGGEKGYIPVIDYVDDIIILETMDPTSIQDISACIAVPAIECPFEGSVVNCTCGMADRDTVRLGGVSWLGSKQHLWLRSGIVAPRLQKGAQVVIGIVKFGPVFDHVGVVAGILGVPVERLKRIGGLRIRIIWVGSIRLVEPQGGIHRLKEGGLTVDVA